MVCQCNKLHKNKNIKGLLAGFGLYIAILCINHLSYLHMRKEGNRCDWLFAVCTQWQYIFLFFAKYQNTANALGDCKAP